MIEATKATIQTVDAALDLYKQIIDQNGWTDDTRETATIIGEIKAHMLSGIDLYEKKQKPVFKWCDTVIPLLTIYKNQNSPTPKDVLVKALDDGRSIMNAAQNQLFDSTISFNSGGGELTVLENRLANYFIENSVHMQSERSKKLVADLNEKIASIREFFDEFLCAKDRIATAHFDIGDVKVQIESTKIYVDINDAPELQSSAVQSADELIAKCNEYRKKYE